MAERLQKIISQWGLASRRQAEQWIMDGRVHINGLVAQLGQKADPTIDQIFVDGRLLQPIERPSSLYLMVHKPQGVVSTCYDPWGRQTVLDLLPVHLRQFQGLHPIGRLDYDTTGLLLLTNDGDLTCRLTHPRHGVPKTYHVMVAGHPASGVLQEWRQGIILSGRKTLPAEVRFLGRNSNQSWLEVTLHEGRNRQIRRVAEQLGHPVISLHRVAIGFLQLGHLEIGAHRSLQDFEIHQLRSLLDSSVDLQYAKG